MSSGLPNPPKPEESSAAPGKLRTWWHPLLVNLLRWQLEPLYQVFEEVPVGRKPLQIDVLLLRKSAGDLPEPTRRMLAGLSDHLNEYTLLEFKGPTDALAAGDFRTFVGYAHLYCAQNEPLLAAERLTLLVVAPRVTEGYRQELRACGVSLQAEEAGIWRLLGSVPHSMWLLETEVLAGVEYPLLTLFSPALLRDRVGVFRQLWQAGYRTIVAYMGQQIQQFQERGEEFMMQELSEEEFQQFWTSLLNSATLEERLGNLTPEERMQGLTAEQRLVGLPPEQRLAGLSPEEKEQLLAILQQQQKP